MLLILLCCVLCDKNELTQEAVNTVITNKGVISSIKNYTKNSVENIQVPAAKANTKTQPKYYSSSIKSTTNDINENTNSYEIDSGKCGDEVNFSLYSDGELDIYGKGNMYEQFFTFEIPYSHYINLIKSVVIKNGVTSIGENAFIYFNYITSVIISNDVKYIGNQAFFHCVNLMSINLPNGITSINKQTFCFCWNLFSINIPESVTSIGDEAFLNASLTSINIPKNVRSIGTSVFEGCSRLEAIYVSSENQDYMSKEGVLFSHNETILYVYPSNKNGIEYSIPYEVTSIGAYAFDECNYITSVNIQDEVKSIGKSAFEYCYCLMSINLPNGITSINEHTFGYCKKLSSIIIPESVKSICEEAFGHSGLTSIYIPKNVSSIAYNVFEGCSKLEAIYVSSENQDYMSKEGVLFSHDETILYVYPSNKNRIEYSKTIHTIAFHECSKLSYISIPSSVSEIEQHAFLYCSELSSIIIRSNIVNLNYATIDSCYKLSLVIYLGNSASVYSRIINNCPNLNEVHVLPNYESDSFCYELTVKRCIKTDTCGASSKYIFDNCSGTLIISG